MQNMKEWASKFTKADGIRLTTFTSSQITDTVSTIIASHNYSVEANIFMDNVIKQNKATVFGYYVSDPERYGVVEFDDNHNALLENLGNAYQSIFMSQEKRPEGMGYFDFVMSEVHGLRIKELLDEKEQGRKIIGSYCVFVPEEIVLAAKAAKSSVCGFFGVSDLAFVDAPGIILGPGDPANAHTADEFIKISDVNKASEIYQKIIKNYLA